MAVIQSIKTVLGFFKQLITPTIPLSPIHKTQISLGTPSRPGLSAIRVANEIINRKAEAGIPSVPSEEDLRMERIRIEEIVKELLTNAQVNEDEIKMLSYLDDKKKKLENGDETEPTTNNPFMNINLITDKRDKPKAVDYYDNKEIKKDVTNRFNFNLYRDVSDLYNKNNSQREYYTMPSTTIPNEQTSFAKWCYRSPPTCKEDTIRCVPETSLPEPTPQLTMNNINLN